ncbi:MAG: DDE-type integrase/transposase/recombinase [Pirellulales bacterium]|nr:DDE-type integrase/transposase/recombinase [Pirellulales bacterium]
MSARWLELPRGWNNAVRSAVLHVMALAHFAIVQARGRAVTSLDPRVRRRVKNERLRQQLALSREAQAIKDARMARIPPARRPRYAPIERMRILELKAAEGWSLEQTAQVFQVSSHTVSQWLRRVDEEGPGALVQLGEPVNKFPQFVGYLVRCLKTLCPTLGRRKVAETLARAGLHLGATTVARMLREKPRCAPRPAPKVEQVRPRVVTAKRLNHVWHVDLTIVPLVSGFWTTWLPFALPQCWPFCYWVAAVVDHASRRALGVSTFYNQPSAEAVCAILGRTVSRVGTAPKYVICDRGMQFDCRGFRRWCRRNKIRPRYGAVGQHGSIAVVERFIRTFKESCPRRLLLVPLVREMFQREVRFFIEWYNAHRPHVALGGRTPDEVYYRRFPAHRRPRFEPRTRWPRGAPCARPWALTRGRPGARLELEIEFLGGGKHLPVVTLRRAA